MSANAKNMIAGLQSQAAILETEIDGGNDAAKKFADLLLKGEFKANKYADYYPLIEGDDLVALRNDILRNGLSRSPFLIDENGHVIDGRNRLRAMLLEGEIKDVTVPANHGRNQTVRLRMDYQRSDMKRPMPFSAELIITVVCGDDRQQRASDTANEHRRHLTKDQRAAVAALRFGKEIKTVAKEKLSSGGKKGGSAAPNKPFPISGKASTDTKPMHAAKELAEVAGVGRNKADQALKLDEPTLKAVAQGDLKLDEAVKAKPKPVKATKSQLEVRRAYVEKHMDHLLEKVDAGLISLNDAYAFAQATVNGSPAIKVTAPKTCNVNDDFINPILKVFITGTKTQRMMALELMRDANSDLN